MIGVFIQPPESHFDKSELTFDDMKHVFNPNTYSGFVFVA